MKRPMPDSPDEAREARLTALLLGELPPDEASALRAEIEADPALRKLHAELAQTVSLLREAVGLNSAPQRLPAAARADLLARLQATPAPAKKPPKIVPVFAWRWLAPVAVAASLTLLLGAQWAFMRIGSMGAARPLGTQYAAAREEARLAEEVVRAESGREESLRRRGLTVAPSGGVARGAEAAGAQRLAEAAKTPPDDAFGAEVEGWDHRQEVEFFALDGSGQKAAQNAPQPVDSEAGGAPASRVRFYYRNQAGSERTAQTLDESRRGDAVAPAQRLTTELAGEPAPGAASRTHAYFDDLHSGMATAGDSGAANELTDAKVLVQEGRLLFENGRYVEAQTGPGTVPARDSGNEAANYYGRLMEEGKMVADARQTGLLARNKIAEIDNAWMEPAQAERLDTRYAFGGGKASAPEPNFGRSLARKDAGLDVAGPVSGIQASTGSPPVLMTNSAAGAYGAFAGAGGGFGGGGMGGFGDALGIAGGTAAGFPFQPADTDEGAIASKTPPETARPASANGAVSRGFASFGLPTVTPAEPAAQAWHFQAPTTPAAPSAGTQIAAGRRTSGRAGGATLESLDLNYDTDGVTDFVAPPTEGVSDLELLASTKEKRLADIATLSAESEPAPAATPPPADNAEGLDLRMMRRYGLMPRPALTRAEPESAARGRSAGTAAGRDMSTVVAGQATTAFATLDAPESAAAPRPTPFLAGEPALALRRQSAAPSELAEERYAGLGEARDRKDRLNEDFFARVEEAPVLGDAPMLGALFAQVPATPAPAIGPEPSAERPALAEAELAPLPLDLPVPAFMGTPVDFAGLSPQPDTAGEVESRERVSRLARKGTTVVGDDLAAVRLRSAPVDGWARQESEVTEELKQVLERSKSETAVWAKGLPQGTMEVERLAEAPPPVAGKPLDKLALADRAPARPVPPPAEPLPETQAAETPFSTFSLNVADVSFKLAAAALDQGQLPDPAGVRSEEFVNAFDYRDPEPLPGQPVAFTWERARYPFAHNREVMRFALKTAAAGRDGGRPLNLVLLLDSSGSMERADRVRILRNALDVLGAELKPEDLLSIVTFSSTATLRASAATGVEAREALQRATEVPPEGGTNLEDAMQVAYQAARQNYLPNGINRVVVLTDGAANLGNVVAEPLKHLVETNRKQGIAFDAFGVGWEGYNDDLLEVLTRNGDGRYGFMNTPEEAADNFAQQLAGALQVAASDVKVQIEFNPARVNAYRQIGYQKHQLTKEQFRDNTVDAAEIGAAEAGNALYVTELKPYGQGPIGQLRVRFRVPATGEYQEKEWRLDYAGPAPELEQASPALRLATTAAGFAEWLARSPYAAGIQPGSLMSLLGNVPEVYGLDPRPRQFQQMLQQARSIAGL
ncbi:MAG: von Willebrand factor type A domain-containing protein [Verrucomicrobiales bacterium]|nr:von Willebrand factor type A domain-containing protein [Verrucomicrobiales bacterium]